MPLLVDLEAVPAADCDHCLEDLHKAISDPSEGSLTWEPHPDPLIRGYIEDATARFQRIIEQLQDALARALTGEPIGQLAKADLPWLRWDPDRFAAVASYLEAKPRTAYSLEDWMLLVDLLLQRYLGDDVIQSEAEYLSVRAALLGKLDANMTRTGPAPEDQIAEQLAHLVPTRFAAVPPRILTPREIAILRIGKERVADHITAVTEGTRSRMKTVILEHVQAQVLGQKDGTSAYLRTRLFEGFGVLNRDLRRIAVTEIGETVNQGFIAACKPGQRVKRKEAYRGACPFCAALNGRVLTVVQPDAWTDGQTQVWVGKTNVGRSAAPHRRTEDGLVARSENERWWPAAGLQHPNCRGSWAFVQDKKAPAGVDQDFHAWMTDRLKVLGPRRSTP